MASTQVLCIDLGASNGRGFLGSFDGTKLRLDELLRFTNGPVDMLSHQYVDIFYLYKMAFECLYAARRMSPELRSFAIDGWAQDFGLIDSHGQLSGMPRHYRDPRTGMLPMSVQRKLLPSAWFARTGKVPPAICTPFQLAAIRHTEPGVLERSQHLLFLPNLLGYFLTGELHCDTTLASASALYDQQHQDWSSEILNAFDIPRQLLPTVSSPGRTISPLLDTVRQQLGFTRAESGPGGGPLLVSAAQHDTISALFPVWALAPDAAYISCGTWAVVGTAVTAPILHPEWAASGLCNEPGPADGLHFLVKYMTGLWILQECVREWGKQEAFDYASIQQAARASKFRSAIDAADPSFAEAGHMPGKIADYCLRTKQQPPEGEVDYFICIMRGLALGYREAIRLLQETAGRPLREIRIVGGGSQNAYLCQLTSDLTGLPVIAGPVESGVAGNAIVQLQALGELTGASQTAEVLRQSFHYQTYLPTNTTRECPL